ncbi:MAG TPA: serine/threonine-protein kinase, partial [Polyangia bacterium]|nr:serine/threonine-protein kinase [Polyangia bacterium]
MTATTVDESLLEANVAEQAGDRITAVVHLRRYLAAHPADRTVRLRLGRLLLALDERTAGRFMLTPLDDPGTPDVAAEACRLLARLDEIEGALTSAELRWERLLADDIDDPEARARLEALRPKQPRAPTDLSLATLAAPEGVRTSRFRLMRELGRGSSATVYLVRDERLELPLALKVLHPQLAGAARADGRRQFFAEARVAASLRHPGVVAIYDFDETTRSLAMEYVPGGTLRDRIRRAAASASGVAADEVRAVAVSLLHALAYVHEAGVVHGDLKPGNVLLRAPGEVVLADFGGAYLGGAAAGNDQGTPLYLAPEQFRGAPASATTDLFATGAIL